MSPAVSEVDPDLRAAIEEMKRLSAEGACVSCEVAQLSPDLQEALDESDTGWIEVQLRLEEDDDSGEWGLTFEVTDRNAVRPDPPKGT